MCLRGATSDHKRDVGRLYCNGEAYEPADLAGKYTRNQ